MGSWLLYTAGRRGKGRSEEVAIEAGTRPDAGPVNYLCGKARRGAENCVGTVQSGKPASKNYAQSAWKDGSVIVKRIHTLPRCKYGKPHEHVYGSRSGSRKSQGVLPVGRSISRMAGALTSHLDCRRQQGDLLLVSTQHGTAPASKHERVQVRTRMGKEVLGNKRSSHIEECACSAGSPPSV